MQDNRDDWAASWEQLGTRTDDAAVPIRVGVLSTGDDFSVAMSIASGPPVTFSDRIAADLAELMAWATEERDMLTDLRERERTDDAKTLLNRAILTHRQWRTITRAIGDNATGDDGAATAALRASAPRTWLEQHDE
ncbi:MAG: hypothetical protein GEU97_10885 [Actinophytocola sp.]|nr:hypothetical protein [Actinophytocola sp.]